MKKELTVPATDLATPLVLWSLLLSELAITSCLMLSGRLPSVLVRSLQLFLRF